VPPVDGSDDAIRVGCPGEGFGIVIVFFEEAFDGGLEANDRMEDAAFQSALGKFGEEALDRVEPGARGWREMEDETWMARQPGQNPGVLVGGIVVENDMDDLASRHLRLDGVKKADEFLVAVSLHALPEDFTFEHVEGGEQRCGAVALIIMHHGSAPARLQRQTRLGAVECLDLRLLIDRKHDGMGGRIDVEPNDILQLGHKLRVTREFETSDPVRLKLVHLPDPSNRAYADPNLLGYGRCSPMSGFARRICPGSLDHPINHRLSQGRNTRRAGFVMQQTVDASLHETLLPAPDRRLRFAGPSHDLGRAQAIRHHQDDRRQTRTISRTHLEFNPFPHTTNVAQAISKGDPMLELIH